MNRPLESIDERELLAVRAMAFVLRHKVPLFAATLLCGLAGAGLGALASRGYESTASIEVGVRPPNEPLENPIITRERWSGLIEKNRARFPSVTSFKLENARDTKTRALTRVVTAVAYSTTASAAQALLNDALVDLLAEHEKVHAFEMELIAREKSYYVHAEEKISAALQELAEGPQEVSPARPVVEKKPQILSGALLEVQRLTNVMSAMSSPRRFPMTSIVEAPTAPEATTSRVLVVGLAGALAGAILGFGIALFRELTA